MSHGRHPHQSDADVGRAAVIGLGGIPMRCRFGDVWDVSATLVHRTYTDAVARGGGRALIVVPDAGLVSDPDPVLDVLDGLVLAGGSDLDPALYGAEPEPQTKGIDRLRDAAELALLRGALERDMPVLGICRGMELLNVARGGTLVQHLPARLGHTGHLRNVGTFERHDVELRAGSEAARLAGELVHSVRSHHHQAVDTLGEGVAATGWDAVDGIVEAIELTDATCAVGVQWHPEEDPDSGVIPRFVRAVSHLRGPRSPADVASGSIRDACRPRQKARNA